MRRSFSSQGGYLAQRKTNPASLAMVMTLHGAAVAAALLITGTYVIERQPEAIGIIPIEEADPPPPLPPVPEPETELPPMPVQTTTIIPNIESSSQPVFPDPPVFAERDIGPPTPPPADPPAPPRDPVRVTASFLPRAQLQPAYPSAMRRAGTEGSVTVRVQIGTDGRVIAVERVNATNDAFFEATRRQALERWRFRPATQDGIPVVSWQTHTVVFRLENA